MWKKLKWWFLTKCYMQPDVALGWHDNLACAAMDEGASWWRAQKIAARFMKTAFDVDTSCVLDNRPPFSPRDRHSFDHNCSEANRIADFGTPEFIRMYYAESTDKVMYWSATPTGLFAYVNSQLHTGEKITQFGSIR